MRWTPGLWSCVALAAGLARIPACAEPPGTVLARAAAERVRPGFVRVEAELGSDTGFVADARGLVVTGTRGPAGSEWAVVRFPDGSRRAATVLVTDREAGISVLRFDPAGVTGLAVLPAAARGPVQDQQVFLWTGDLLTGSVYRTEPAAIILDRNPPASPDGLPLFNLSGEVVGLACARPPGAPKGADVWGYRPIAAMESALALARKALDANPSPAASSPLPAVSPVPIAVDTLLDAALRNRKPYELLSTKNMSVSVLTPYIMASMQKGPMDAADLRANITQGWQAFPYMARMDLSPTDPVVTIEVTPVPRETARSKWIRSIVPFTSPSEALGIGKGGSNLDRIVPPERRSPTDRPLAYPEASRDIFIDVPEPMKERSFREGFLEMQLLRAGKPVEPVRRVRFMVGEFANGDVEAPAKGAFGGACAYDPSVFRPDEPLTLRIRKTSDPSRWQEIPIDMKTQRSVWDEFVLWRVDAGLTPKP